MTEKKDSVDSRLGAVNRSLDKEDSKNKADDTVAWGSKTNPGEAPVAGEDNFTKVEEVAGQTVVTNALTEEDAKKQVKIASALPKTENLTQSLTGVPGQVNLTQDGALNSDKSLRDTRDLKEVQEEEEMKSGPNPTPNRDGNELLKRELGFSPNNLLAIDNSTNEMARKVEEISKRKTLTADDQRDLESMAKRLRDIGKA